jgi:hypothetical protein
MKSERVPETALVIPALQLLYSNGGEMSTTQLIEGLIDLFDPTGEDAEILQNREDSKFSQKVRNLKSHKTLEKAGWAEAIPSGFRITDAGRNVVESIR